MLEVGDVVRLQPQTNTDPTGNAVDAAGGVVLSVTLPDGTAALGLPGVQHPGLGQYYVDYPTVQAGRHLARFVGSGVGAFAESQPFNVWPTDPRFMISLADAKRAIQRSSKASSFDEDLRFYIAAVTPVIEDITGPMVAGSVTETFDGGQAGVLLSNPVTAGSVVSVSESGSVTTSVTVDYDAGIVYAGSGSTARTFAPGRQNITVTYGVGQRMIPSNVLLAAREELRFLWQIGQQSEHPGIGDDDSEVEYTPSGFAVPRRVVELCAGQRRLGGFA